MSTLLSIILNAFTVFGAADTACAESGRDYKDGAIVLQVVINRANGLDGSGRKSLDKALFRPKQHAHGCRWPLTKEHFRLGKQFMERKLPVPDWSKKALWYCNSERPGTCENRCVKTDGAQCPLLGKSVHRYFGRPERRT